MGTSTNCNLEFTTTSINQSIRKTFSLNSIINKKCELPKEKILYENIMKDANEKRIIPKRLVLVDREKNIINNIDLKNENNQYETWFVPNVTYSYILYDNILTSPTKG